MISSQQSRAVFGVLCCVLLAACKSGGNTNDEVLQGPNESGDSLGSLDPIIYAPAANGALVYAALPNDQTTTASVTGLPGALEVDLGVTEVCAVDVDLPPDQQEEVCTFELNPDGSFYGSMRMTQPGDTLRIWTNGPGYERGSIDSPNAISEEVLAIVSPFPLGPRNVAVTSLGSFGTDSQGLLYLVHATDCENADDPSVAPKYFLPTPANNLPTAYPFSLASAPSGELWMATLGRVSRIRFATDETIASVDHFPLPIIGSLKLPLYATHLESGGLSGVWILAYTTGSSFSGNDYFSGLLHGVVDSSGQMTFTQFTTADGLPSSWVNDLSLASDGSLWVATGGGLAHLTLIGDGASIVTYTTSDGLPSNTIIAVSAIGDKKVWVATRSTVSLLTISNVVDIQSVGQPEGLPAAFITDLAASDAEHVWVATLSGLAHVLVSVSGALSVEFVLKESLSIESGVNIVGQLALDENNGLWAATSAGLRHLLPNPLSPVPFVSNCISEWGLPSDEIQAAESGSSSGDSRNFWIGTGRGISRVTWQESGELAFRNISRFDGLINDDVSSVKLAGDGTVWAGTTFGLERVTLSDSGEVGITHYTPGTTNGGLPEWDILALEVGTSGEVWVGTTFSGVIRMQTSGASPVFTRWSTGDGLPGAFVRALKHDPARGLWIAWWNSSGPQGLSLLRPGETPAIQNFVREGLLGSIHSLELDPAGQLWIGSRGGLSRLEFPSDGEPIFHDWTVESSGGGLPSNDIKDIAFDAEGGIWLATPAGLVHMKLDSSGAASFRTYTPEADGLPTLNITTVAINPTVGVLAGTANGLVLIR